MKRSSNNATGSANNSSEVHPCIGNLHYNHFDHQGQRQQPQPQPPTSFNQQQGLHTTALPTNVTGSWGFSKKRGQKQILPTQPPSAVTTRATAEASEGSNRSSTSGDGDGVRSRTYVRYLPPPPLDDFLDVASLVRGAGIQTAKPLGAEEEEHEEEEEETATVLRSRKVSPPYRNSGQNQIGVVSIGRQQPVQSHPARLHQQNAEHGEAPHLTLTTQNPTITTVRKGEESVRSALTENSNISILPRSKGQTMMIRTPRNQEDNRRSKEERGKRAEGGTSRSPSSASSPFSIRPLLFAAASELCDFASAAQSTNPPPALDLCVVFDARYNRYEEHVVNEMRKCVFSSLIAFLNQRVVSADTYASECAGWYPDTHCDHHAMGMRGGSLLQEINAYVALGQGLGAHVNSGQGPSSSESRRRNAYPFSLSLHFIRDSALVEIISTTHLIKQSYYLREGRGVRDPNLVSTIPYYENLVIARRALAGVRRTLKRELNKASNCCFSSPSSHHNQPTTNDVAPTHTHTVLSAGADPSKLHAIAIEHLAGGRGAWWNADGPYTRMDIAHPAQGPDAGGSPLSRMLRKKQVVLIFSCCGKQCGIPSPHLQQKASAMLLKGGIADEGKNVHVNPQRKGQAKLGNGEEEEVHERGFAAATGTTPTANANTPTTTSSETHIICYSTNASATDDGWRAEGGSRAHARPLTSSTCVAPSVTQISPFITVHRRSAVGTKQTRALLTRPPTSTSVQRPLAHYEKVANEGPPPSQQQQQEEEEKKSIVLFDSMGVTPYPYNNSQNKRGKYEGYGGTSAGFINKLSSSTRGSSPPPHFPPFRQCQHSMLKEPSDEHQTMQESIKTTFDALNTEIVGDFVTPVLLVFSSNSTTTKGLINEGSNTSSHFDVIQRERAAAKIALQPKQSPRRKGQSNSLGNLKRPREEESCSGEEAEEREVKRDTNVIGNQKYQQQDGAHRYEEASCEGPTAVLGCTVFPFTQIEKSSMNASDEDEDVFRGISVNIVGSARCEEVDEERLFGTSWSVHLPPPSNHQQQQNPPSNAPHHSNVALRSPQKREPTHFTFNDVSALEQLFCTQLNSSNYKNTCIDPRGGTAKRHSSGEGRVEREREREGEEDRVLLCTSRSPALIAHYFGNFPTAFDGHRSLNQTKIGIANGGFDRQEDAPTTLSPTVAMIGILSGDKSRIVFRGFASEACHESFLDYWCDHITYSSTKRSNDSEEEEKDSDMMNDDEHEDEEYESASSHSPLPRKRERDRGATHCDQSSSNLFHEGNRSSVGVSDPSARRRGHHPRGVVRMPTAYTMGGVGSAGVTLTGSRRAIEDFFSRAFSE